MNIQEILATKVAQAEEANGGVLPRDILRSLIEVVKDGDIDADDFPALVEAVKDIIAFAIPLINVPYIPAAMESVAFDSWAVPLAQGYADELVAAVFGAFHIPVK